MKVKDIILAIFVALIWGSYFTASKIVLTSFPPFLSGGIRFLILFILTIPFYFKDRPPFKHILFLSLLYTVGSTALYISINNSIKLSPLILIFQLNIPIAVFLGIIFLKENFSLVKSIGLLLSLVGLVFIAQVSYNDFISIDSLWLVLFSAICFAFYNLTIKDISSFYILTIIARMSLFIFPQLLLISFFQETWPLIENIQLISIIGLFYKSIICTLLANLCWIYLLSKYPLSIMIPFTLLTPVFGCFISTIVFNEILEKEFILGGFVVIIGLIITEYGKLTKKKINSPL